MPYRESKNYSFDYVDVRQSTDEIHEVNTICASKQAQFDLNEGPLLSATMFITNYGERLFICIHHLVVDSVSFQIILEDFFSAIKQSEEGKPIQLPAKTASYIMWSESLQEYCTSKTCTRNMAYWGNMNCEVRNNQFSYSVPFHEGYNELRTKLAQNYTVKLLTEAGTAYKIRPVEIMLSALAVTLKQFSGKDKNAVSLEGHGREELEKKLNISRTVGWFTSVYPVVLNAEGSFEDVIVNTKEMIRTLPKHGFDYQFIKGKQPVVNVFFNYNGEKNDSSDEDVFDIGLCTAKENHFSGELNFNAFVVNEELTIDVSSNGKYGSKELQQISKAYIDNLERIIDTCCLNHDVVITMSDLDDDIDMEELDVINELLGF